MNEEYFVMFIKRAHDPLSGTSMDMWAVMDKQGYQVAYCSSEDRATLVLHSLVAYTQGSQGEPFLTKERARCE